MIDYVVIIAGGPSLKEYEVWNYDFRAGNSYVIGANDAGIRLNCNAVLTMDRLWLENRIHHMMPTVIAATDYYVRRDVIKNITEEDRKRLIPFECDYKSNWMSSDPKYLNGTNSGLCSLNLAYQKNPKKVYLLGFDMCKTKDNVPYWYPSYDWERAKPEGNTSQGKYNVWTQEFADVKKQFEAKGIEVINVNHRSKITCFKTISFKEFIKERGN